MRLPRPSARLAQRLIHASARLTRPLTLGVRAIILDDGGRVFLVRHSYVPGWHLPGGGVEAGEAATDALSREVREECEIEILSEPRLHGIFFNRRASRRDHVLVYVVRNFRRTRERAPDWEIVGSDFFDPAALPQDTTPATRARLAEVLEDRPQPKHW